MDRLHREALAERPPFSEELHSRIMRNAKERDRADFLGVLAVITTFNRQDAKGPKKQEVTNRDAASFKLAASPFLRIAAVLVVAVGLIATWEIHLRRGTGQDLVVIERAPKVQREQRPIAIFSPIDISGVVSARLFPPELRIQLPTIAGAKLPESQNFEAQSGSVFESLDAPADSATQTIADMVPPSLRAMVKLAQSATFADTQVAK